MCFIFHSSSPSRKKRRHRRNARRSEERNSTHSSRNYEMGTHTPSNHSTDSTNSMREGELEPNRDLDRETRRQRDGYPHQKRADRMGGRESERSRRYLESPRRPEPSYFPLSREERRGRSRSRTLATARGEVRGREVTDPLDVYHVQHRDTSFPPRGSPKGNPPDDFSGGGGSSSVKLGDWSKAGAQIHVVFHQHTHSIHYNPPDNPRPEYFTTTSRISEVESDREIESERSRARNSEMSRARHRERSRESETESMERTRQMPSLEALQDLLSPTRSRKKQLITMNINDSMETRVGGLAYSSRASSVSQFRHGRSVRNGTGGGYDDGVYAMEDLSLGE